MLHLHSRRKPGGNMITADYCRRMAQHNAWQNTEMDKAFAQLSAAALSEDRGAFFGSILGTANHLMWGDLTWLSRFDGGAGTDVLQRDSASQCRDYADWADKRRVLDQRFLDWAAGVSDADVAGMLSWYSVSMERDFTLPKALCLMQMFNHQTHHRGQIHAMVTAAGVKGWTTDLPFMPDSFHTLST